jgi:hypothetical protein
LIAEQRSLCADDWLFDEERATEVLITLNHLDIARMNEVIIVFTRFIKCVEGNFVSYFDIFPILQKLPTNLGFLRTNKHRETLRQAASQRFSRTTDLNIIFACCLATPVGERYYNHNIFGDNITGNFLRLNQVSSHSLGISLKGAARYSWCVLRGFFGCRITWLLLTPSKVNQC